MMNKEMGMDYLRLAKALLDGTKDDPAIDRAKSAQITQAAALIAIAERMQQVAPRYVHIGSHVLNVEQLHHVRLHCDDGVYISHGNRPGFFLEPELCEPFRNWWNARADVVRLEVGE